MEILKAFAGNFADIRVLLLFYCVEAALIAYAGLGLLGVKIQFKNLIKIGIFHGLAVSIIRGLYLTFKIPFGTHTLILVLVMSILISRFGRIRFGTSLTAALLGIVTLILGESLVLPTFNKLLGVSVDQMWANPWTQILAGYVGDVLLIAVAILVWLTNFSLLRIYD